MIRYLISFLLIINVLYAHPHFFIDSKVQIIDKQIKNEWIFDRLNSRVLLFDFDKNENKVLDKDEKEEFIKAHFLKLKDNNYNIFLSLDDEIKIEPKNINVKFEKKRLSILFDINLNLGDSFTFCTIDEKIYMAYKLIDFKYKKSLDIQRSEYDYCLGVNQ